MKCIPIIALALSMLLSGCVNLKPKPDRTQLFMLASEVAVVSEVAGKPECYVGRVELPGYLEGKRIYYRSPNGELDSVAGSRWAEPLRPALPSALAMHLQATGRVNVRAYYPWQNTVREGATVSVQFERFSANAKGAVEVIAQWQITKPNGSVESGRFIAPRTTWDRENTADYVAKFDAALAALAATIAQQF